MPARHLKDWRGTDISGKAINGLRGTKIQGQESWKRKKDEKGALVIESWGLLDGIGASGGGVAILRQARLYAMLLTNLEPKATDVFKNTKSLASHKEGQPVRW